MLLEKQTQLISGKVGDLEVIIDIPENENDDTFAILCHPHPVYGGTMHNKVVTTMARTCHSLNVPSIRFNFRGVGQSAGEYDNAIGEIDDCLAVIDYVKQHYPNKKLWLMGFSFGAYIAAKSASMVNPELLVTIAPPVGKEYFENFPAREGSWVLVQARDDDVIDAQAVFDWYDSLNNKPELVEFDKAGHFFHGNLIPLRKRLENAIKKVLK